jgi:hypothetical protein
LHANLCHHVGADSKAEGGESDKTKSKNAADNIPKVLTLLDGLSFVKM